MKEFDKVIGYEEDKKELERIADMMLNPDKYKKLGVHTTRGLLIHGNPGVGKTLMANCLIKASRRTAFTVRKDLPDGDFVKYIVKVFDKAKKQAPSIVFLDDMDKYTNQKNGEEFVTIQSCIDNCQDSEVFVLATANDIDIIPDSLTREGRFDKTIYIGEPRGEDAKKIISHYLKKKKCGNNLDYETITRLLKGGSCATLETIINEAGVYAGFENRTEVTTDDFIRAILRKVYGSSEKNDKKIDKYVYYEAYHEAGHVVVAEILEPGCIPFVTINALTEQIIGGFTNIDNDKNYYDDMVFMENRVKILLAGKAAIEVVYGDNDVGCCDDIKRSFNLVERFVNNYCCYGFNMFDGSSSSRSKNIDSDCKKIITYEMEKYYQQAKKILIQNRKYLDAIATELANKKILVSKDIQSLKGHFK